MAHLMLQTQAQGPSEAGDLDPTNQDVKKSTQGEVLRNSSVQNIEGTRAFVDGAPDGAQGSDVDGVDKDFKPSLANDQEIASALARLRAKASSMPLNPKDPATVAILQQISNLEQQLARLESNSLSFPVLPTVSLDITASTIFVTGRIARFLLLSVMPPAALAVILSLAFNPKSGRMSAQTAILFSALAIVLTALFYLASSIWTMIKKNKTKFNNKAQSNLSSLTAASYLFVLGSGGHTTEMISLVKLSQKPYFHTHRRYLMTVGDDHSPSQVKVLEEDIANRYPNGSAGTSDLVTVTRARSVHQSYATSVFTSLKCFFEIVDALTSIPSARRGLPNSKAFRSPHVIVTNGPGTGFIVGLVAFVLKVFRVVPHDRLKVVFVETWARTHSLGLTGKLFHLTQIADVFVVQSDGLAKAFKKPNIGNVNKKWAALVNSTSKEVHDAE